MLPAGHRQLYTSRRVKRGFEVGPLKTKLEFTARRVAEGLIGAPLGESAMITT